MIGAILELEKYRLPYDVLNKGTASARMLVRFLLR